MFNQFGWRPKNRRVQILLSEKDGSLQGLENHDLPALQPDPLRSDPPMDELTNLVANASETPAPVQAVMDQTLVPAIAVPSHPWTLRVFRPLTLAKLAFLFGLFVFFPFLVQRLPDLNARPEYRVNCSDIQLIPEPERPIPKVIVEQIQRQNQLPAELSLLDPSLCQTIAVAFAKHPWIERVVSVEMSFPPKVIVRVEYRRPVAMVQVKGGRVPIDAGGSILPSEDFDLSDVTKFPTIRLAGSSSLIRRSGQFKELGLTGAVQVAQLLGPKWNKLKLEAIELPRTSEPSDNSDDIQFVLQSREGSTILWGRAPGSVHPGELTPPQKVARLERYLEQFGAFDRPSGPYEIDIRHWQEITRKPFAKVQTSTRKEAKAKR